LKLQTKYFGEIEYEAEEEVRFPSGIFGFEDERRFLLLPFEGSHGTMLCLQSMKTPALAFVVLDPFSLMPEYAPELREAELIYETRRKNFIFYELDLTVLDEAILWLDNLRGGADHEQNAEKNVYCLRPADPSDADSGAGGAALSAGPHPGPL